MLGLVTSNGTSAVCCFSWLLGTNMESGPPSLVMSTNKAFEGLKELGLVQWSFHGLFIRKLCEDKMKCSEKYQNTLVENVLPCFIEGGKNLVRFSELGLLWWMFKSKNYWSTLWKLFQASFLWAELFLCDLVMGYETLSCFSIIITI